MGLRLLSQCRRVVSEVVRETKRTNLLKVSKLFDCNLGVLSTNKQLSGNLNYCALIGQGCNFCQNVGNF